MIGNLTSVPATLQNSRTAGVLIACWCLLGCPGADDDDTSATDDDSIADDDTDDDDAADDDAGDDDAADDDSGDDDTAECTGAIEVTPWPGRLPDLAADEGGVVHLSYVDQGQIHLVSLEGDQLHQGWTVVGSEVVPNPGTVDTRFRRPRIAVGGGAVHLLWGSSEQDLEYARWDGASWVREHVATVQAQLSVPQIAATDDGSAHVIYQWCETMKCPVSPTVYWRRDPQGTWHGPEPLSADDAEWRDDALAADGTGRVHGLWKAAARPGQHRIRDAAGAWGPVQEIAPSPGGTTVSFGDLAIGPGDHPHHAFFEFGTSAIGYTAYNGSSWAPTVLVDGPGLEEFHEYDMRPGIAVAGNGVVAVSWAQWSHAAGRPDRIRACEGPGPSWTCGDLSSDVDILAGDKPAVAFGEETLHVVWRGGDGVLRWAWSWCPARYTAPR